MCVWWGRGGGFIDGVTGWNQSLILEHIILHSMINIIKEASGVDRVRVGVNFFKEPIGSNHYQS